MGTYIYINSVVGAANISASYLQNVILEINERMKKRDIEREKQEPARIIGYQEVYKPGKSWEECIKEYGRGINELNTKVVDCKNGYKEKVPIYNK